MKATADLSGTDLDIIGKEEADVIHARLADLIRRHFPECLMAFTSGSVPYGAAVRGRSDIDVNVVLPDATAADEQFVGRINGFIDKYARLHHIFGLRMDGRFPGEYFTAAQASDAAAGRGVPVVDGVPCLPLQPDDAYWLTSDETWYLPWMGALAFNRYLAGDRDRLHALSRKAWSTIVCLCLPDLRTSGFQVNDVLDRIQQHDHPGGGFGILPTYHRFPELVRTQAKQALCDLTDSGIIYPDGDAYRPAPDQPHAWQHQLAVQHERGYPALPFLTVASSLRLAR